MYMMYMFKILTSMISELYRWTFDPVIPVDWAKKYLHPIPFYWLGSKYAQIMDVPFISVNKSGLSKTLSNTYITLYKQPKTNLSFFKFHIIRCLMTIFPQLEVSYNMGVPQKPWVSIFSILKWSPDLDDLGSHFKKPQYTIIYQG
jgi:hypothetical protein